MPKKVTKKKKGSKKPVTPGRSPRARNKNDRPDRARKLSSKRKLTDKGVDEATADRITGVEEDLTREEIAGRRIDWQKTLTK